MDKSVFVQWKSNISDFMQSFFEKCGIHGVFYFGQSFLTIYEKIFWLNLIVISVVSTTLLSLESYNRYQTKNTVVSIEKDHYYWNTSLPSITICPIDRLSKSKFDTYCRKRQIQGTDKEEFWQFLESLANSTYGNFENIKGFKSIDKMYIDPRDYMSLIYNLTDDMTRRSDNFKVKTINNLELIKSEQILTEFGLCYVTNNFHADNISSKYLLEGVYPEEDPSFKNSMVHKVRFGNLFDGDITYSFIGFNTGLIMFVHSPYETIKIARKLDYTTEAYEFEASSIEIVSDQGLEDEASIAQRNCRFPHESNLVHFDIYTKSLCLQECRINLAFKLCKCIPHFYPNRIQNPKPVCHYQKLKSCIAEKSKELLEIYDPSEPDLECNCMQNCVESVIVVEHTQVLLGTKELLGSIGGIMIVKKYPLTRFKRQVLFTFTDLLVSIGGTAGLFLGFSVLSAVEIIYFFTLRLFWYTKGRR